MAQHMLGTIKTFLIEFDSSLSNSEVEPLAWTGLKRGIDGDDQSQIDAQTGLVVDPITGANESTVAWTNLSEAHRLSINQYKNNYMHNTQPFQQQ
ncbi:hypothetical protein pgond44_05690 [Psychroflexus gondwanensis ACAM 44]|uniref:Uncharacterized protein n=1 Tax=Psychroflexus gondwanensis ACAM 44 TaxID=1189619 RepID=N1WP01_9FLAO|nr:hypothetical protein [Psychroflexus gondwanensis]EMY82006.1 hypothetical protein pgond44_05690 [Psychroflexus gondwanensis ACAM 44]